MSLPIDRPVFVTLTILALGGSLPCLAVTGASADLSITNVSETFARPGLPTHFDVTARNDPSGSPVNLATVAVSLSAASSCSAITWSCAGANGGTCAAGGKGAVNDSSVGLPPGGSVSYRVTCDLPSSIPFGSMFTIASVTSAVADPAPENNTAMSYLTVTPIADLAITVTDDVFAARPGGSVTYHVVAFNQGASDGPRSIVQDSFSPACRYIAWTCVGAMGGRCASPTGVGPIDQRADLPAGASVTYTAICNISSSATGTLVNTATIRTGDDVLVEDYTPDNDAATDTDALDGRGVPIDVPTLDGAGLCILALAVAVLAVVVLRRKDWRAGRAAS